VLGVWIGYNIQDGYSFLVQGGTERKPETSSQLGSGTWGSTSQFLSPPPSFIKIAKDSLKSKLKTIIYLNQNNN
jgi:hypothetical protein